MLLSKGLPKHDELIYIYNMNWKYDTPDTPKSNHHGPPPCIGAEQKRFLRDRFSRTRTAMFCHACCCFAFGSTKEIKLSLCTGIRSCSSTVDLTLPRVKGTRFHGWYTGLVLSRAPSCPTQNPNVKTCGNSRHTKNSWHLRIAPKYRNHCRSLNRKTP